MALAAPALLVAVVLAACGPAPTVAGVARFVFLVDTAFVEYQGQGTVANRLTVGASGTDVVFTDTAGTVTPGTGCSPITASSVRCALSGDTGVRVQTGDGADTVVNGSGRFISGELGPGNDAFTGGANLESFDGGPGDDLLRGAGGNDLLSADVGDDVLDGGEGDDQLFEGGRSSTAGDALDVDTFIGGPGTDTVSYGRSAFSVRVDLNGVADDGRSGEGDDVRADVEHAGGGNNGDVLVGNEGPNVLAGREGGDIILGGGGPDVIVGEKGDDVLSGEAGDDELRGGEGTEALDGGPGTDICDIGLDLLGFTNNCEIEVVSLVGDVSLTPQHVNAEPGTAERLRVTWTHPEAWRQLETLQVRLVTPTGAPVFRATWTEATNVITQTLGVGIQLHEETSDAAGRNERKVVVDLVVLVGPDFAGVPLDVAASAVDDDGSVQDWDPVGTVHVSAP